MSAASSAAPTGSAVDLDKVWARLWSYGWDYRSRVTREIVAITVIDPATPERALRMLRRHHSARAVRLFTSLMPQRVRPVTDEAHLADLLKILASTRSGLVNWSRSTVVRERVLWMAAASPAAALALRRETDYLDEASTYLHSLWTPFGDFDEPTPPPQGSPYAALRDTANAMVRQARQVAAQQ